MVKSNFSIYNYTTFDKAMDCLMLDIEKLVEEGQIGLYSWEIILLCTHDRDFEDRFLFAAIDTSDDTFIRMGMATVTRDSCKQEDIDRIKPMNRFKTCGHEDCGVEKFSEFGDDTDDPQPN